MAVTAKPASASVRRIPHTWPSWMAALVAVGSIFAWRDALVAWIDTSSSRYEMAEPFIGIWMGALTSGILLLVGAGAVIDRGWRWLAAIALIPIAILGFLLVDGLIGGLRNGIVSPAGLSFGIVSAAQVTLLVAWLAFAIWRGRRIG